MTFQRRSKIPIERARIVTRDTKSEGVHHADQFLCFGVAGSGIGFKLGARLYEFARFHQITGGLHIRKGGQGQQGQSNKKVFHLGAMFLGLWPLGVGADPLTVADFPIVDQGQAALGQLLFYDKVLSGNQNISCATCHHPSLASADGLPLGVGEGGEGLGRKRTTGAGHDRIERRVPRNAPALWNLGALSVHTLMHDGRIAVSDSYGNGFTTPAEEWLPDGLDSLLAAQALFPLTSETEMRGEVEENEVAGAVNERIDYGWPIIAKRVRTIPVYGEKFVAAFDHIDTADQVTIVDISNAIGAFVTVEFQSYDSPYDRGDLTDVQQRGQALFTGKGQCASCHAGPLFTDQKFHALGVPPIGPGRTRKFDPVARDVGRMGKSNLLEDAYRFRTPPLRNVALTAPYGHNGSYASIEAMITHHNDPVAGFDGFSVNEISLPAAEWLYESDTAIWQDSQEIARQRAAIVPMRLGLTRAEVEDLAAFLRALTGDGVTELPFGVPDHVPSGLPVDRP